MKAPFVPLPGPSSASIVQMCLSCVVDLYIAYAFPLIHFFFVKKKCEKRVKIHFPYLLLDNDLCKDPRTLQKFPLKCQKIAGC